MRLLLLGVSEEVLHRRCYIRHVEHLQVIRMLILPTLRLRLLLRGVSEEVLHRRCYIRQEKHFQVTKNLILTNASPAPSSRSVGVESSATVLYSTGEASKVIRMLILPNTSPSPSSCRCKGAAVSSKTALDSASEAS